MEGDKFVRRSPKPHQKFPVLTLEQWNKRRRQFIPEGNTVRLSLSRTTVLSRGVSPAFSFFLGLLLFFSDPLWDE